MDKDGFSKWLTDERNLKYSSRNTMLAKCAAVERAEGNLDTLYDHDHLAEVLNRLTYSSEDSRNGITPRHSVKISGDPYTASRVLKSAVKNYKAYRDSQQPEPKHTYTYSSVSADTESYERQLLWKGRFLQRYKANLSSLYNDPIFKLVLNEVRINLDETDDEAIKAAVRNKFIPLCPEKRFDEVAEILRDVSRGGYRKESGYNSVFYAMLILDAQNAERHLR